MPTLSNGITYANPFFQSVFAEYLIQNGFFASERKNKIMFYTNTCKVVVENDTVTSYGYHPEVPGEENEKWVFEQHHSGISHLNLHGWIMLLHLMNIIMIDRFLRNAEAAGQQAVTEAKFIINNLHQQQLKAN
jgi:hypothetical protein